MGRKYRYYVGMDLYEEFDAVMTCDYHSKSYAIVEDPDDPDGKRLCLRTVWSLFRGRRISDNEDCDRTDVIDVANGIIDRAERNGRSDRLQGEHYNVTDADNGMKRAVRGRESIEFSRIPDFIPCLFGILLTTVASLLYAWTFQLGKNFSWLVSFFPSVGRYELLTAMYVYQLIFSLSLYLFRKNDRGFLDVMTYTVLPLNLLVVVGIFETNKVIFAVITSLLLIYAVVCIARHFRRSRKNRDKAVKSVGDKALYAGIAAVFLTVFCSNVMGVTADYDRPAPCYERDLEIIEESYTEAVGYLDEEVWRELSETERISVLQKICDYECVFVLGCDTVVLRASYQMDEGELGSYGDLTRTIYINGEFLNRATAKSVIKTMLHESRHVWQADIVRVYNDVENELSESNKKLPMFDLIRVFRYNGDTYNDGEENYDDYYYQEIERDSRNWAEQRIRMYYPYI